MKFKEYKNTDEYKMADVLELYSEKTGLEYDCNDYSDEELDELEVVRTSGCGTWLSVTLKG